ncbi:MAG TPA: hypothetical protein GX405_10645 [Rhizobiales bacterium]|nr:hypothetical protein [Hyphomicrobiales bacterium]
MKRIVRPALAIGLLASLTLTSACTVRPLYSSAPATSGGTATMAGELASIAIKPVTTREAQQVRNHLTFLFYGGAAEPASPAYTLSLSVSSKIDVAASIQQTTEDEEPTAKTVTMVGRYWLLAADGTQVAAGRRQITSSYDIPSQEFAALRAERDAQDRAARELAELLRLAVAQDLASR